MILGKRYRYDAKPLVRLNYLQSETKQRIKLKLEHGIYQCEPIPCCVCQGRNFEALSQKDRYGLFMPVVICRQCGLIQTNPRMTQGSYNSFYKDEYQALHKGREFPSDEFFAFQFNRGRRIHLYLKNSDVLVWPPDKTLILEVGCGAGGILAYFREQGYRVKGIDLGEEYLEFGKRKHSLELSTGIISDIQSFEKPPDVVIYSHTLEHILHPQEELAQICHILSLNGIVYIEVPGIRNIVSDIRIDFLRFLEISHVYHFTLTTLQNLMQRNGFQLITGDETVRSIWRRSRRIRNIGLVNDYEAITAYLHNLEVLRKALLPIRKPYRFRSALIKAWAKYGRNT